MPRGASRSTHAFAQRCATSASRELHTSGGTPTLARTRLWAAVMPASAAGSPGFARRDGAESGAARGVARAGVEGVPVETHGASAHPHASTARTSTARLRRRTLSMGAVSPNVVEGRKSAARGRGVGAGRITTSVECDRHDHTTTIRLERPADLRRMSRDVRISPHTSNRPRSGRARRHDTRGAILGHSSAAMQQATPNIVAIDGGAQRR